MRRSGEFNDRRPPAVPRTLRLPSWCWDGEGDDEEEEDLDDEARIRALEARLDRENGADSRNCDTFGDTWAGEGWSFEEALAANERLAASGNGHSFDHPNARAPPAAHPSGPAAAAGNWQQQQQQQQHQHQHHQQQYQQQQQHHHPAASHRGGNDWRGEWRGGGNEWQGGGNGTGTGTSSGGHGYGNGFHRGSGVQEGFPSNFRTPAASSGYSFPTPALSSSLEAPFLLGPGLPMPGGPGGGRPFGGGGNSASSRVGLPFVQPHTGAAEDKRFVADKKEVPRQEVHKSRFSGEAEVSTNSSFLVSTMDSEADEESALWAKSLGLDPLPELYN
ncbi:unnamed protein product [Polarella glacialis]|uniref:Uncharacterized protein n=1 Tax=Polarella glacialis TaxID=89957 RepID=A0A813GSW9_POLGL|nr:unnamed protein product [Polarella glacialis]